MSRKVRSQIRSRIKRMEKEMSRKPIYDHGEINPNEYHGKIDKNFIDTRLNEIAEHILEAKDHGIIYVMSGTPDNGRYINFQSDLDAKTCANFMIEALTAHEMLVQGSEEIEKMTSLKDTNDGTVPSD